MNPAASAPDLFPPDGLLATLLDVSLTAVHLVKPFYEPGSETIVDFTLEYLNPAGQRMTGLPERPGGTALTRFPHTLASGIFDYYRRVFEAGDTSRYEVNYQADGLDSFFRFAARRHNDILVVSFSDTIDETRTPVEDALRASQARERAARADAERERNLLQAVLTQAPVAIGLFRGDDQVVAMANDQLCAMWGYPPERVRHRPLLEGVPELRGQGFAELIAGVARTRVPFVGTEVPAQFRHAGQLETHYFNFVYQPLYDVAGGLLGVLDIAIDVTEQVLIRRQVQELNEALAITNGELQAANEEFLVNNTALTRIQLQLQDLNEVLEIRVQERTQQLEAALREAEQQREQLREQQGRLRQILGQVPASIATLVGPTHRHNFFNDGYQALSGGRTQLGQTVAEVFPEVAEQGFITLLDAVYATGQPFIGTEMPVQLYNSTTGRPELRYVDFIYQPLLDEQGRPQGILAFILDSTKKVLAQHAEAANAHQLRLLTDALPVLIGYLDRELRYRFTNRAYEAWFNQPADALLGRHVRDVVGEKAFLAIRGYMEQVLAGERLEFNARMPYREDFIKHIHTDYIPDVQNGEVLGFYTLVVDMTEQVVAREQAEQTRQQVQALNEELAAINGQLQVTNEELGDTNQQLTRTNIDLDNFIYTASHDLKAPIANIEGLLHALREHLPTEAQQAELVPSLLGMMQNAVERFQATIAQLTDLSQLQQVHAQPAELVALAAVVEDVRLDLAPMLAAADARLTVDVATCPFISFPPKNLRSIVYNLLSNAVKYRHPTRVPVVQVRCHRTGAAIVLEVQDNGLGLTETQQTRLFGMFQRLHDHVEGSGIGLYMVKKIVENAGGTIAVQSEPGVGSTFRVSFPG